MKLEDLFVKQRPPKDYVSFPPQETPTLEKFFKERTAAPVAPKEESPYNMFGREFLDKSKLDSGKLAPKEVAKPISDELSMTSASSEKIEQPKVDAYKAIIQQAQAVQDEPQAPMADMPQVQAQPQMQSRSDLIDAARVREQADLLAPQASGTDFALGLIPLALDVLTGGTGAGAEVAGKYYMDKAGSMEKRKQTLEDKLMEIEKSRAIASAKGGSGKLVEVDVDGKPIFTPQNKAEGLQAWKAPSTTRGDMEIGRQMRFEQAQKDKLRLADRQFAAKQVNDLNKDADFKTAKARYSATNDAINVLNQKNWAGDQGAGFLFAKGIFGEVGSLTNEERSAFIANPVLENKYNFLFQKYLKNGTFTDEDRSDLQELALHMRKRAEGDLANVSGNYIDSSKAMGVDISDAVSPLLRRSAVEPKYIKSKGPSTFPARVMKGGKMATVSNKKEYDEAFSEGWR